MNMFFKPFLLSCFVVSVFVFSDLAMAQRWGRGTSAPDTPRNERIRPNSPVPPLNDYNYSSFPSPNSKNSGTVQPPANNPPVYLPPSVPSRGDSSFVPSPPQVMSRRVSLEPGDVILAINGERVYSKREMVAAVQWSDSPMYLTIRDKRTGNIIELSTHLSSTGVRLGIYSVDSSYGGGGARVTSVIRNSAATRCYIE